jgi:hypothetical protein
MKILIQFFLFTIGLSILLGISTLKAVEYWNIPLNEADAINCITYYCFLTCLVFYISYLGFKKGPQQYILYSYASLGIRFLSGLLYILYYTLTHKIHQNAFAIYFLLLFILFIVFEIYNLTTKLRSDSARKEDQNDSYK